MKLFRLFMAVISLSSLSVLADNAAPDTSFVESFIKAYDISGRFNHEYHPALLEKTRESFLGLEKSLRDHNFKIAGRAIIMGYQEDAIPAYQTDCAKAFINDEAVIKSARGITTPDRNVFGYLTGFALKDAQWMQATFNLDPTFIHVQQNDIDLFQDASIVLQKHAFKDIEQAVFSARDRIEHDLVQPDPRPVLQHLISFWEHLYHRSLDNNFFNTIATQDILFSIDYAKAILEGNAPVQRVFIGPDITYPIEVSDIQKKEVTQHAQQFIKIFMEHIKPINNKKTAYIFCSFVDGVGKSTLLNNIINYFTYGDDYQRYERCDNSSSQEATLYHVDNTILMVDLPGQVSHFTSKPQGYVYADMESVTMKKLDLVKVIQYAKKNKDQLIADFVSGTWPEGSVEQKYQKNCELLCIKSAEWIPFEFRERHYLFNKHRPQELRVLVPLEEAHSTGLKMIEPHMMLFSRGLSLPMPLEIFYRDLCQKLQDAGVEEIVFVDFMSMYPRTSRETVRLNFILQQLRWIFGDRYPLEHNLYRSFVHQEQEIYHLLKSARTEVREALILEAVMRWAIHELLVNKQLQTLYVLDPVELQILLQQTCNELLAKSYDDLKMQVEKKLQDELVFRHETYALDRIYHTVIRHSCDDLVRFSQLLCHLFETAIQHGYLNALWHNLDVPLTSEVLSNRLSDGSLVFGQATAVSILNAVARECKNTIILEPLLNLIRSQWYAVLENLLYCERRPDGSYRPSKIEMLVPPLVVKQGPDGQCYLLQKVLPSLMDKSMQRSVPLKYHLLDMHGTRPWGLFAEKPHCLDWSNPGTFFGLFAFGFNPMEKIKSSVTLLVEQFMQECRKKGISNAVMPTSEIVRRATQFHLWGLIDKEVVLMHQGVMKHISAHDSRLPLIRLWARMIATLEMIAKDPQAVIVVRKGNREDFASCLKLLERITLPVYYGIQLDTPLFSDYTTVEPTLGWHVLE